MAECAREVEGGRWSMEEKKYKEKKKTQRYRQQHNGRYEQGEKKLREMKIKVAS